MCLTIILDGKNGLATQCTCPFSTTMGLKHQLAFCSNIGKPSLLLLNQLFGIQNTEGHGNCGNLCLLYAFGLTNHEILEKITNKTTRYLHYATKLV